MFQIFKNYNDFIIKISLNKNNKNKLNEIFQNLNSKYKIKNFMQF